MEQVKSTRMATLYFIRVDDDGSISRHDVQRTVSVSDSPMSDALEALMSGPDADEIARGFISLIPSGARLLSAQVRGSTAYLNFNDAFMYNRYGIEGYAGQLKQIVYTATEPAALEEAVLRGAGIGFMSKFRAEQTPDMVEVLPPRAEWESPLRIVTHVDLHRTRKVQAFLTHLKEAAKEWKFCG